MGLEGKLADMPIFDLLRIFQRGKRSGKLMLWNDREWGVIWLMEGQAVSAAVLNKPDRRLLQSGEEAIFSLFDWADGQFRYSPDSADASYQSTIARPTSFLMIEALRRRKGGRRSTAPIELTMQTPLSVLPQLLGDDEHIRLSAEERMVLICVGRQTTVQEVVDQTGLPPEQALMTVAQLIDCGLIVPVSLADLPQRKLTVEPPTPLGYGEQAPTPISNLTRAIRRRLQQIALGGWPSVSAER